MGVDMIVDPVPVYRRLKYPRIGEVTLPKVLPSVKSKAIVAAMLAASGIMTGCDPVSLFFGATAGDMLPPPPLSAQEIIQILKYEAEELGVSFDTVQDTVVRYSGQDISLDLYNKDMQIGAAVVNPATIPDEGLGWNTAENKFIAGKNARGSLEAGQEADFFLTTDQIPSYHDEDLRQAFREFIEWLQSEGII